ncbi:MAG: hypothetical protein ACYC35_13870 [Pirellulales bacterium]
MTTKMGLSPTKMGLSPTKMGLSPSASHYGFAAFSGAFWSAAAFAEATRLSAIFSSAAVGLGRQITAPHGGRPACPCRLELLMREPGTRIDRVALTTAEGRPTGAKGV